MMGINKQVALKMFWDAGYNSESKMIEANELLKSLKQPVEGFYYAEHVIDLISKTA